MTAEFFSQSDARVSGIVGKGVVIRIGRFLVQTPLGTWSGLWTQPYWEAPSDLPGGLQVSKAVPLRMAQSWPWGSQMAITKKKSAIISDNVCVSIQKLHYFFLVGDPCSFPCFFGNI